MNLKNNHQKLKNISLNKPTGKQIAFLIERKKNTVPEKKQRTRIKHPRASKAKPKSLKNTANSIHHTGFAQSGRNAPPLSHNHSFTWLKQTEVSAFGVLALNAKKKNGQSNAKKKSPWDSVPVGVDKEGERLDGKLTSHLTSRTAWRRGGVAFARTNKPFWRTNLERKRKKYKNKNELKEILTPLADGGKLYRRKPWRVTSKSSIHIEWVRWNWAVAVEKI